jgi:mRNA interferase MazF
MTNYRSGDVVLIAFPFASGAGVKHRPAVVLLDAGDSDIVVVRVTTQEHTTACDVPINDWTAAGLLAPSIVRVHKVATLEKALVRRQIGRLEAADWGSVAAAARRAFANLTELRDD